jgi:hypothetical protein
MRARSEADGDGAFVGATVEPLTVMVSPAGAPAPNVNLTFSLETDGSVTTPPLAGTGTVVACEVGGAVPMPQAPVEQLLGAGGVWPEVELHAASATETTEMVSAIATWPVTR